MKMNYRPTENKAFYEIEKKDRLALAGIRSGGKKFREGVGILYSDNTIYGNATHRLDVRKPERMRGVNGQTPLY